MILVCHLSIVSRALFYGAFEASVSNPFIAHMPEENYSLMMRSAEWQIIEHGAEKQKGSDASPLIN